VSERRPPRRPSGRPSRTASERRPPAPSGGQSGASVELGLLAAALVLGTLAAEALGAANLGTALTFGQIAFAATALWILLRRP
jgi:hypothetical protein